MKNKRENKSEKRKMKGETENKTWSHSQWAGPQARGYAELCQLLRGTWSIGIAKSVCIGSSKFNLTLEFDHSPIAVQLTLLESSPCHYRFDQISFGQLYQRLTLNSYKKIKETYTHWGADMRVVGLSDGSDRSSVR